VEGSLVAEKREWMMVVRKENGVGRPELRRLGHMPPHSTLGVEEEEPRDLVHELTVKAGGLRAEQRGLLGILSFFTNE